MLAEISFVVIYSYLVSMCEHADEGQELNDFFRCEMVYETVDEWPD